MAQLPKHIGIIMDGNGRWAAQRALPRAEGHRQGVGALKRIVRECGRLGIKILTVYAFSSENWKRPRKEIEFLMGLLRFFAAKERNELHRENVRLTSIGDLSALPPIAIAELQKSFELTASNTGLTLQLALNYSGRNEICRAVQRMLSDFETGSLRREDVSEEKTSSYLDTANQPEPDLIIRTSGEYRVSNFMIWQAAYAEYFFTNRLWPDFNERDLREALEAYAHRERRYGGLSSDDSLEVNSFSDSETNSSRLESAK